MNHLYIAPLPSFCKVNPNLPSSELNQVETIVTGIQRDSETAEDKGDADRHQKKFRLSDFEKIEKIGEGTFGKVYRAEYKDPETGQTHLYALKKLNMIMDDMVDQGFPLTALREIKYLSTLHHENIVSIKQVIDSKPNIKNKFRGSYFLLFDYLAFDLTAITDKQVKFSIP